MLRYGVSLWALLEPLHVYMIYVLSAFHVVWTVAHLPYWDCDRIRYMDTIWFTWSLRPAVPGKLGEAT